jgi:acyl carrier protein
MRATDWLSPRQAEDAMQMTKPEIFENLEEIIKDVFLNDALRIDLKTTAKDVPGWDSFKMIQVVLAVEERFGISMETRDIDRLKSVGDLVTRICDKLQATR